MPEIQQDQIRELWVRPYRVIYVIRGEDCHVMAIAHASRDLPTHLFSACLSHFEPFSRSSFATAGYRREVPSAVAGCIGLSDMR